MTAYQVQQLYLAGLIDDENARILIREALRTEGRVGTGAGQISEDNLDRHIGLLFQSMVDAKGRGEQQS